MGIWDAVGEIGSAVVGGLLGGGSSDSGDAKSGGVAAPTPVDYREKMLEPDIHKRAPVKSAADKKNNYILEDPHQWAKEWNDLLKDV